MLQPVKRGSGFDKLTAGRAQHAKLSRSTNNRSQQSDHQTMRRTLRPLSIILSLFLLCGQAALCQEAPSLPRLPRQEQVPGQSAQETAPADSAFAQEPPPAASPADTLRPVPLPMAADSAAAPKKPLKKLGSFKLEKIRLDRNGKVFLAATAVLMGLVYLSYQFFRKDVK
jgi:hypothetical protein